VTVSRGGIVGTERLLSALTYLFYIPKFRRFEDSRAGNCHLAQRCLISKILSTLAEMIVASPSSGTQGQCAAAFYFSFLLISWDTRTTQYFRAVGLATHRTCVPNDRFSPLNTATSFPIRALLV